MKVIAVPYSLATLANLANLSTKIAITRKASHLWVVVVWITIETGNGNYDIVTNIIIIMLFAMSQATH